VEKGALRIKTEETGSQPSQTMHTYLSINRLNFNIWSKIDLGMEYRTLFQKETDDSRKGWLAELMWEPKEHFRIGAGYNFTDFSDNEFSDNDYSVQGWFTRIQVKY
jgi:long-subunit fatty acid transport protein